MEPLPVPMVTVSHERDFLSLSPQSLHFWESLSLEPFSQLRDIVYFVLTPGAFAAVYKKLTGKEVTFEFPEPYL